MSVSDVRLRALVQDAARSTQDLFQLLVEGLDWPVPDGLDLDDIELDWRLDELHLDPDKVPSLRSIKQIPPLTTSQDFGVFILEFDNGRLPIGAIRRVVDRLVQRKRARVGSGRNPTWSLDDLLFFCFTEGTAHALHVVAFQETAGKRVLRVLSWAQGMTPTRMDLLLKRGIPALHWASDRPAITVDTAGFHGYREAIRSAAALSTRMAELAQDVRAEVGALYQIETDDGPIRILFREVRNQLLGDLTPARFADVYAQTMVYGLLTARIAHPEQFQADQNITAVSFENPFLDAIYSRFRAQSSDVVDVDELGLRELAEQLAATDVDELLADFGAKEQKDDPVVFFYEDFLARYDPQQRRDLGAFYTPIPVVRYIVRSVDHALKSFFGLPLGVAAATTWGEWQAQTDGRTIPVGADPDEPVARMIDPANGTGTFFVEWLRQVEQNAGPPAVAAALGRMDALEISLASYAVAHLKVSLGLPVDVRERIRLPIYLGDTLADRRPHVFDEMADPVSTEGSLADQVKFERIHNVVIGNPPYDRVESTGTGGLVTARHDGHSLFDDILDPARAHTIFSHHASLYNLYVYFWRWALWQAFEKQDGPAIISMITASSWLTGPGFLGLRQLVRELGDEVYVVDLGGENKGARKEENVFDIESPVAIVTVVRRANSDRTNPARVLYRRVHGTRAEKLRALDDLNPAIDRGNDWSAGPSGWHNPLAPPTGDADWSAYPSLVDLLPWQQPGAMISRTWPIAPSPALLRNRWTRFVSTADPSDRSACFVPSRSGRNITTKVAGLPRLVDLPVGAQSQPIVRFGNRSFDLQWTFRDPRLAKTESPSLWASLSERQIFMTTMTTGKLGHGPAATITTAVPDKHFFSGRGGKDVIPLYRDARGTPNADPALLRRLSAIHQAGAPGTADVTGERLFAYAYGLLAGTDYAERFAVALETPGPRVPLTADPELFDAVVRLGERLLFLHTFGERTLGAGVQGLPRDADIRWGTAVTKLPADLAQIQYDQQACELHVADGVLVGVAPDVWQFEVSGMQVVRKWLGYRTAKGAGRSVSSASPLDHIRPSSWLPEWGDELRDLVDVLTQTVALLPDGVALLDRVCAGPLVAARELPDVPPALRQPPTEAAARQDVLPEM